MAARDKMRQNMREKQEEQALREKIKKQSKKKGQRMKFLRVRMWVHYVLSAFQKDRGKIPNNIGDRVMITNNVIITRYYMSSIIHIRTLGLKTPFVLVTDLTEYLRDNGCDAVVDMSFKNKPFEIKLKESGLLSRIRLWERTAEMDDVPQREKETAARCLYTVEMAKRGYPLYNTRIFIKLRAKSGSKLTEAEQLTYRYLELIGAEYAQITTNLRNIFMYTSLLADHSQDSIKDIKAVVTSEKTLAEMMPNSGSFNGRKGNFIGINILNGSQFNIEWSKISLARNAYVVAPSGVGKTVLALNMCSSAVEQGYAVCVQDIKGNEFNSFINATDGFIVSLRQSSSGYINSFAMHKNDVDDENAEAYFSQRIAFSKEQMLILSGVMDPEKYNDLEELFDSFLDSLYISLGVLSGNRNSWHVTETLNPFEIYEHLMDYMTPEVIQKYSSVSRQVMNALRMTMSRDGSKSYIFREEFDYAEILKAETLMFDFGLLDESYENIDMVLFRLKFAYMRKLNAEYVAYKYGKGIKIFKVLEESQIAVSYPDIMKGYVEEFTLRRAQGQTTLLLGNSVAALLDSGVSKSLVENTTALFVGLLEEEARKTVIEKFSLQDYEEVLRDMKTSSEFRNSFLFINKMEDRPAVPVLRVKLEDGKKYKLFTPLATTSSFIE